MRTSKPFSTISYNTENFLQVKLNDLIRRGILDFWAYVLHFPEDDEKKVHKHLYCVPSKLTDTSQIIDFLQEADTNEPLSLPLGCIMPMSSKFGDWFQYVQHNVGYLASKGQSRKYQYSLDDFKTSDLDYFNEIRHRIDLSRSSSLQRLQEAVEQKTPFADLVVMGVVPFNLITQYQSAYNAILNSTIYRNGRDNHEDKIDYETGEVISSKH